MQYLTESYFSESVKMVINLKVLLNSLYIILKTAFFLIRSSTRFFFFFGKISYYDFCLGLESKHNSLF